MRLNRFLAGAGLGSRRACEELIREGRIDVNGVVASLPGPEIDPATDVVRCDGEHLHLPERWIYLALYKPPGVLTTLSDERGRPTVSDLLGRFQGKVFPVGRLDRTSEGLLLLTNNGELANRLLHPRYRQERTYVAWVRPAPTLETLRAIHEGVRIGPRERSGPARTRLMGRKGEIARVKITLREGKNREIHRIFQAVGSRVMTLRRIAYAGITIGGLAPGHWRILTRDELKILAEATGLKL